MLSEAIVRTPGVNFESWTYHGELGRPDFALVLEQHAAYCEALCACGVELTTLEPDVHHPDSTFVEDTAIVTARGAISMRPGAEPRWRGGGDSSGAGEGVWCHAGDRGAGPRSRTAAISARRASTSSGPFAPDQRGRAATGRALADHGLHFIHRGSAGDDNDSPLKSGIAHLSGNTLVVMEEMAEQPEFPGYRLVRVGEEEGYAADCVEVNGCVLILSRQGFQLTAKLKRSARAVGTGDVELAGVVDGGWLLSHCRIFSSE